MASIGLPGTAGFVGEFLALIGAYQANSWVGAVATTGIILGAAYMLYLYWRVAYGTSRNPDAAAMPDLNKRELVSLGAIAAVVLWMGIYPESFLAPMRQDVGLLLARVERATPPTDGKLVMGSPKPAAHGAAQGTPAAHGTAGDAAPAHDIEEKGTH